MNLLKEDYPFSVQFDFGKGEFSPYQKRAERKLSDLSMMFQAKEIVKQAVAKDDPIIYEIFYDAFCFVHPIYWYLFCSRNKLFPRTKCIMGRKIAFFF